VGGHSSPAVASKHTPPPVQQPVANVSSPTPVDSHAVSGTTSPVTETTAASKGWRLQLISGISDESTRTLVGWLKQQGYEPIFEKRRGVWTVYVGDFSSSDSPEATDFREKFRAMEYQGKKQFTSCLLVQRKD